MCLYSMSILVLSVFIILIHILKASDSYYLFQDFEDKIIWINTKNS